MGELALFRSPFHLGLRFRKQCGLEQDSPPPRLLGAGFREFSLLPLAISFVVLVYLSLLALQ